MIMIVPNIVLSHEDNASRVEFWKKYYNPKIENDRSEIPTVNIELKLHPRKIKKIIILGRAMESYS